MPERPRPLDRPVGLGYLGVLRIDEAQDYIAGMPMPLTDIFAHRYRDTPLWTRFGENERRLLVQASRIVSEQLFYPSEHGVWDHLNGTLSMELGVTNLSALSATDPATLSREQRIHALTFRAAATCQDFLCGPYDDSVSPDRFLKERLSFVEIAFRKKEDQVAAENANLDQELQTELLRASRVTAGPRASRVRRLEAKLRRHAKETELRAANERLKHRLKSACRELNARFRQAEANLHYHNGFIQLASDDTTVVQIEQPFWSLLRSSEWRSVDREMKEAIDLRDTGGPDPAFHAAKALESAIKIISDSRTWTHGRERGASSYLDNLRARKNGEFIAQWEYDILHKFFSAVRNPSAHGAGSDRPLSLSDEQTDWAIGFCMIWIRNLIRRTKRTEQS